MITSASLLTAKLSWMENKCSDLLHASVSSAQEKAGGLSFDFDAPTNRRGSGSLKWDDAPCTDFPLWVADMDFLAAPCIREALEQRVAHGIFGYAVPTDSYYNSIVRWHESQHQVHYEQRWMIVVPGVVPAISAILRAMTREGDGVLTLSPAYNCFYSSIRNLGCRAEECQLQVREGRYEIDFTDLERRAAKPDVSVMLLCSPHNPTGRVWSQAELEAIADICVRHDVFLVSDEIHCELTMPGHTFLPLFSLRHPVLRQACTCTSASKAFNMAGLQNAQIICASDEARARIDRAVNIHEVCDVNPFGLVATEAAYTSGAEWLHGLRHYLWDNYLAMSAYLDEHCQPLRVMPLEATYLMWVDVRALGLTDEDFCRRLIQEQGVRLAPGSHYGKGGEGYVRINLATQRERLMQAARRICEFVKGQE